MRTPQFCLGLPAPVLPLGPHPGPLAPHAGQPDPGPWEEGGGRERRTQEPRVDMEAGLE